MSEQLVIDLEPVALAAPQLVTTGSITTSSLGASRFMLHTGGEMVSLGDLSSYAAPPPTGTHYPTPHSVLAQLVAEALTALGYQITDQVHAVNKEGQHYFGMYALASQDLSLPYQFVVGLRNSYDKSVACRLALGSKVFVCDNLAFTGEINLSRKNTRHAIAQLPILVTGALGRLGDVVANYAQRATAYQAHELPGDRAAGLLMTMLRQGAVTAQQLAPVWDMWEKPPFPDFEPRTLWSLFNAVTGVMGDASMAVRIPRTQRLHAVCDGETGVMAVPLL